MFIPQFLGQELALILGVIQFLEDILESSVVFLQDGVFGGHVEGIVSHQSVLEASVSESGDGFIGVVPVFKKLNFKI